MRKAAKQETTPGKRRVAVKVYIHRSERKQATAKAVERGESRSKMIAELLFANAGVIPLLGVDRRGRVVEFRKRRTG
jgi:isocitrate dehydrogenase kinase/phosphatase